jgi:hypothetical protein
MNGHRFDAIARRVAGVASRRRVAGVASRRRVARALIAAVLLAGSDATAERPRRPCRRVSDICLRDRDCCTGVCDTRRTLPPARRNRCGCPDGLAACGRQCIDLDVDRRHCGVCGRACAGAGMCVDGECVCTPRCDAAVCGDDGCGGSCGVCGDLEACVSGLCVPVIDCETYTGGGSPSVHVCLSSTDEHRDVLTAPATCAAAPKPVDGAACASDADCQAALVGYPAALVGICNDGYRLCATFPGPTCAAPVSFDGANVCTYVYPVGATCPDAD